MGRGDEEARSEKVQPAHDARPLCQTRRSLRPRVRRAGEVAGAEVIPQWMERQLLPPRDGVTVADVVDRGGWIPSAGGTGPYLAIRARIPLISRQAVDDAVFGRMELLELPSVRDTAFLVPRSAPGLAL